MIIQERIRACRLIEKANKNKNAAQRLGIRYESKLDLSKAKKERASAAKNELI